MAQWVVHRDPRWYDAPEEFRPERWEDDLLKTIAAVRLFSVRRRAAPVHREHVCADGSNADFGDDRAEVSFAAGRESSRGAPCV